MTHLIAYTKNKVPVYVNLIGSDVAENISRNPRLLVLAAEIIEDTSLEQPEVSLECDMGRPVGYDFAIKTSSNDAVFYAQLQKDTVYTRFIKNGKPQPTNFISMVMHRSKIDASYLVTDIQIGHLMPPKPGSTKETAASKKYWLEHALIYRDQPHQTRSLTKTCPY